MQPTPGTQAIEITPLARCPTPRLRTAGEVSAYLGEGWLLRLHGLLGRMTRHQGTRQRTPRAHEGAQRKRFLVLKELFPALLPLVTRFDPGTPSTPGCSIIRHANPTPDIYGYASRVLASVSRYKRPTA